MASPARIAGITGALITIILLYLFFWPVPIDPVAWQAPVDRGLVDPFGPDDRLRRAQLIDLGDHEGPEDIAAGPDGKIYTGTSDGRIVRFAVNGYGVEVFAETGGRPLGLEFDRDGNLYVANAYVGLQKITPAGEVELLTDSYDGAPINYTDDLAVATDGSVYFSDASSKFGARKIGGSYEASLLDLMEHGGHGSIFRYDPLTRETTVILDGLNFANGVAISDDQRFLMICETGTYRVLRHWLEGEKSGQTEVVIDNLPGFPDNVNTGRAGKFWIGLVAPRNRLLDAMSGKPWLRKLVQRLPTTLRPKAVPSSHVFAINGDGEVLMNLQDPSANLPSLTGVYEARDALWLTSLFGNHAGRLDKRDLANP
jgi:sugar lactone lactonase YvrE